MSASAAQLSAIVCNFLRAPEARLGLLTSCSIVRDLFFTESQPSSILRSSIGCPLGRVTHRMQTALATPSSVADLPGNQNEMSDACIMKFLDLSGNILGCPHGAITLRRTTEIHCVALRKQLWPCPRLFHMSRRYNRTGDGQSQVVHFTPASSAASSIFVSASRNISGVIT